MGTGVPTVWLRLFNTSDANITILNFHDIIITRRIRPVGNSIIVHTTHYDFELFDIKCGNKTTVIRWI